MWYSKEKFKYYLEDTKVLFPNRMSLMFSKLITWKI